MTIGLGEKLEWTRSAQIGKRRADGGFRGNPGRLCAERIISDAQRTGQQKWKETS